MSSRTTLFVFVGFSLRSHIPVADQRLVLRLEIPTELLAALEFQAKKLVLGRTFLDRRERSLFDKGNRDEIGMVRLG